MGRHERSGINNKRREQLYEESGSRDKAWLSLSAEFAVVQELERPSRDPRWRSRPSSTAACRRRAQPQGDWPSGRIPNPYRYQRVFARRGDPSCESHQSMKPLSVRRFATASRRRGITHPERPTHRMAGTVPRPPPPPPVTLPPRPLPVHSECCGCDTHDIRLAQYAASPPARRGPSARTATARGVRDPGQPTPRRLCRKRTGRAAPPAGHARARATAGGG